MHLDDEQLQRLLHGEPGTGREHLAECAECRRRLEEARRDEAGIFALLDTLNHPAPRHNPQAVMARAGAGSRWLKRAAVLFITLGAAAAGYAIPGSPLRAWVDRLLRPLADTTFIAPQPGEAPAPGQPITAGIAVPPGRHFVIRFLAPEEAGHLLVWSTGDSMVAVRARGGAPPPTFSIESDQLVITNPGSAAAYEIELPESALRIEILVGTRRLLLQQAGRISADSTCHKPVRSPVPPPDPSGDERMRRTVRLVATLSLAAACTGNPTGPFQENLDIAVCHQSAGPFSADVTNPYFPLPVGARWVLEGVENGTAVKLEVTVLAQTELVAGIPTRVMEERHTEGGTLAEISRNFFVQTQDGTVCYFGEDVDIYQGGVIVAHSGAWRAGVDGAVAGIFMPASPAAGMAFRQEVAPGVAEDRVVISDVNESVTVPFGTYNQTVEFRETTPLEPGVVSTKVYARTVGLVVDDVVRLISKTP